MESAAVAAERAALAAGVVVRELASVDELASLDTFFRSVWNASVPLVNVELMRALVKSGAQVSGAYSGDRLVGGCVAFFAAPDDRALHSHIAGVERGLVGKRHIGFALKLHQRAWALSRGLHEIQWTFDPLISRNAYFNIAKLGARATEYLPDFYGPVEDGINAGDETDRLLVRWSLATREVAAACAGTPLASEVPRGATVGLGRSDDGRPVPGSLDGAVTLVAAPVDVEGLRAQDPGLAREWRVAVRAALGVLLDRGGQVRGFDRAGWYVVECP